MPYLKVQTNVALDDSQRNGLLRHASRLVAEQLGKPERYVMVDIQQQPHMLFAGNNEPMAYLELKSIGLPENATVELSDKLCTLIGDHTPVDADRVYIEFADAPRHMWGWNSRTFA